MKVVGLLAFEKGLIADVRTRPFPGLWFVDDDGDTTSRLQSLEDLGVVKSEYDDANQSWYFEVDGC